MQSSKNQVTANENLIAMSAVSSSRIPFPNENNIGS